MSTRITIASLATEIEALKANVASLTTELDTLKASRYVRSTHAPAEPYAVRKQRLAAFMAEHFASATCVTPAELAAAGWTQ